MALMQLTIVPLGTDSSGIGEYVADIQARLAEENFRFELTDMGTIIEGTSAELLELAARLAERPFEMGAKRVLTQISLDDRRDKQVGMGDKTASVKARLIDGAER